MNFVYPIYLYLIIVLGPIFVFIVIHSFKKYKSLLTTFVNETMFEKVCNSHILKIYKVQSLLILLIFIIFLITLSSPQWGVAPQEVRTHGVDVILGIDTSKSMLSEDVSPNRLEITKNIISLLLDKLHGNRVGIITFAEIAFQQCPLTLDIDAAKYLLSVIDTEIIPYQGTKIGDAISEANKIFKQYSKGGKVMILFTDGEDHGSAVIDAAEEARKNGVVIFTVGVGTPEGRPIPLRDAGGNLIDYKKDKQGNIVTSKLNEELLTQIANLTNGRYYSLSYGELGIADRLYDEISGIQKGELKTQIYNLYKNRYHYFVYMLLLFFLIEIFVPKKWFAKI